jgi:ankyrin repeat protein
VEKAPEEFKLACLCLSYLNLEYFDDGAPEAHIRNSVIEGCFAFMDYAVVYWPEHLRRCLHSVEPDSQAFGTLVGIVRVFLAKHYVRTKGQPFKSKKLSETFQHFSEEDFFERLIEVVSSAENQMKTHSKEVCKESPLNLLGQATRIRSSMEEMSVRSDPQQKQKLQTLYGSTLFKCARVSCKYFYEGFPGHPERDRHFAMHERAFCCAYPGCHIALLGFKSEKDLTKHEMEYHGTLEDDSIFPWHQAPESIAIDQQIRLSNLPAVETWMQQFENEIPYEFLVTGKNPKGALEAAIICKNSQILKMLLSRAPADLFAKSKNQEYRFKPLLSVALELQNEDAVRMLLDIPEVINQYDMYLMVSKALNKGLDDLAIVLLENPHSGLLTAEGRLNSRSSSYLTLAIRHGRIAVVRFLITRIGVAPDGKDSESRTALIASAEFGQEEITQFLLETGKCNIRATSRSSETAVSMAARQGHETIIRLLFPQDPLPSDVKTLLESARLRNAAQAGDAERVRILLEQKDIRPDLADRSGYTPLLVAAEKGHDSVVKELLRRVDVQLNRRTKLMGSTKYGRTALHLSVYNGHVATVRQLLSREGVDITTRTRFPGIRDDDALGIATRRGNEAIIRLLKEYSSRRDPPPEPPVPQGPSPTQQPDPAQVSASLDMGMGADVNYPEFPECSFQPSNSTQQNFNLNFSTLDSGDVLENFDFDLYLNTDDLAGFSFDPTLSYPTDG